MKDEIIGAVIKIVFALYIIHTVAQVLNDPAEDPIEWDDMQ